jgi:hypothetical protein
MFTFHVLPITTKRLIFLFSPYFFFVHFSFLLEYLFSFPGYFQHNSLFYIKYFFLYIFYAMSIPLQETWKFPMA